MRMRVKSISQGCRQIRSCASHLSPSPHSSKGIRLITVCAETWSKASGHFTVTESIFVFWNPESFTGDFQIHPALEREWEVSPQGKSSCLQIETQPEGPTTVRTLRVPSPWESWWVLKTCRVQAALWTDQRSSCDYMGALWMGRFRAHRTKARGGAWTKGQEWFWYKLWPFWNLWYQTIFLGFRGLYYQRLWFVIIYYVTLSC